MSWGKDASKWGVPKTIRFQQEELDRIEKARMQLPLLERSDFSTFVRGAANGRALKMLDDRHATPIGATMPLPFDGKLKAPAVAGSSKRRKVRAKTRHAIKRARKATKRRTLRKSPMKRALRRTASKRKAKAAKRS